MLRVFAKGVAFFVGTFLLTLSAAPTIDKHQAIAALGAACLALVGYMDKSVANLSQENTASGSKDTGI
jgi:hypothetical protein